MPSLVHDFFFLAAASSPPPSVLAIRVRQAFPAVADLRCELSIGDPSLGLFLGFEPRNRVGRSTRLGYLNGVIEVLLNDAKKNCCHDVNMAWASPCRAGKVFELR